MRFLRARIRGFRNLEDVEIDLAEPGHPDVPLPVAAFVGPNGCGKTAVLEALVRASWLVAPSAATAGSRPVRSDVRSASTESEIEVRVVCSIAEQQRLFSPVVPPRTPVDVVTRIHASEGGAGLQFVTPLGHGKLLGFDMSPPGVVYLDAARYAPREPIVSATPSGANVAAVHATAPSIPSNRFQWAKQQVVNLKLAQMLDREQGRESDAFDRLWRAVDAMLGYARFREVTRDLRILFETPSGLVELDDLSSGEKSVVFMFTDLLVRDLREAAVLIDEVELHLHPNWQRKVLAALRAALPTCQILVTTQSELVAASVEKAQYLFSLGEL